MPPIGPIRARWDATEHPTIPAPTTSTSAVLAIALSQPANVLDVVRRQRGRGECDEAKQATHRPERAWSENRRPPSARPCHTWPDRRGPSGRPRADGGCAAGLLAGARVPPCPAGS